MTAPELKEIVEQRMDDLAMNNLPKWKLLLDLMRALSARRPVGPRVALTSEGDRLRAKHRYEVISPLLEWRRQSGPAVVGAGDLAQARNLTEAAGMIARRHKVSPATVWRWYRQFQNGGMCGLADKTRSDRGVSRCFSNCPQARAFVESAYLQDRLTVLKVHATLVEHWSEVGCDHLPPPSYTTVSSYLASLPKLVVILGRRGETAFKKSAGRCSSDVIKDFRRATWVN